MALSVSTIACVEEVEDTTFKPITTDLVELDKQVAREYLRLKQEGKRPSYVKIENELIIKHLTR